MLEFPYPALFNCLAKYLTSEDSVLTGKDKGFIDIKDLVSYITEVYEEKTQ
jgi:hypothetical protein